MFVFSLPPYAKYNNWCQKRAARKMDHSGLSHAELSSLVKKQKLILNLKCSPTCPDEATITEAQKDIEDMLTALSQATTNIDNTHTNTSHGLMIWPRSLQDAMRNIRTFNPGNNVHRFISDINQAYTINVKPELTNYPEMEEEFRKITKRLLDQGIFQQMEDTYQDMSTFKRLKSYPIATHGNQISNFQHLSRAWAMQPQDGERLTVLLAHSKAPLER